MDTLFLYRPRRKVRPVFLLPKRYDIMNDFIFEQGEKLEEHINDYLYQLIPQEEFDRVAQDAEISPYFMCFAKTYFFLSKLIPKDWTVIDFGAAYNAQSYFFTQHKRYIAINPYSVRGDNGMFCPDNCEIYRMTTGEYLRSVDYPKEKVFAICNYVPNWYEEDSIELVKKHFRFCYTFYPQR